MLPDANNFYNPIYKKKDVPVKRAGSQRYRDYDNKGLRIQSVDSGLN